MYKEKGQFRYVFAALVLVFLGFNLAAQNTDTIEYQLLTDNTMKQFIPVFRAAIAQKKQNNSAFLAWSGNVDSLFSDKATHFGNVTERGGDALAEVTAMSDQLAVPDGLKYYPKTSREASKMTAANMDLFLVFSFGQELPPLSAKCVRNGERDPKSNWMMDLGMTMEEGDARAKLTDAALLKTEKVYASTKYQIMHAASGTYWVSPDSVLTVSVISYNFFAPLRAITGEALPTGPVLVISTDTKMKETEKMDMESYAAALQKSGLDQASYDSLSLTILTAYGDVRDEGRLINPLPESIPGMTEEETKEYEATLLEYDKGMGFPQRRANLGIYRKFAQELDSLIEEFNALIR
jgi:hypothetical protein